MRQPWVRRPRKGRNPWEGKLHRNMGNMEADEKTFTLNCDKWARFHPKEALLLPYVNSDQWSFVKTQAGEPNLRGPQFCVQSQDDAHHEATGWFSGLTLDKTDVLIVYGVGLGYYYQAAKNWLKAKKERYLVFLEDDLAVIKLFFETETATQLLEDKKIQLLYFKELSDKEPLFESLYWDFAQKKMQVSGLLAYQTHKSAFYNELRYKIAFDSAVKNALIDEYLRFGGAFFINFYQNMLQLPRSYLGNRFFGNYTGVPAIICGAGPSLEKNIHVLKTLTDKALIFAGGSSVNALNAAGFQPHFGAGIDPNPMQQVRLMANQAFEVPYFYRNRMYHDAFKTIHGPRLYITGAGGYDIAEYFEEKFDIKEEFLDEGHNVVNFCVEIAQAMGCNPIIFVGMDLAYTGMRAYAPGVVDQVQVNEATLVSADDYDELAIVQTDIYGKPIYTLWKWIAESKWISDYAKEHPLTKFVNATEGGLGFAGVPNETLKDTAEELLKNTYDLDNRVFADIQNSAMPQVTPEAVNQAMVELKDSLIRCHEHLQTLIEENERLIDVVSHDHRATNPTQSGLAALAETELAEESGYKHVCEIFNAVYMRLLSRDFHQLKTVKKGIPEWKRMVARYQLNIKRLSFLKDVAKVNSELIDYAFQQRGKDDG